MIQLTSVVKNLLILNVLMFLAFEVLQLLPPAMFATYYFKSSLFQPYQVLTHMFMHAGPTHLLFNMIGLYFFGPPLENLWGGKRFLFYYLFTGIGALGCYMLVKFIEFENGYHPLEAMNIGMLGASGAIFGLLMGFGIKFPNQKIMLIFPPIPMKAKIFVLFYAALELYLGISGAQPGVAHFAHLGGALFGFILIQIWGKFGSRFDR